MKQITTVLTIVAAGVLNGISATAADEAADQPNLSDKREKIVEQFDADGDGQLNEQERDKARSQRGNRDRRAGRQRGQSRGQRPDKLPGAARLFEQFDENGDDQLSREEFMKLSAAMRDMRERFGEGSRERFGQGPPEGQRRAAREDRPGPPRERGNRPRPPRREEGDVDRFRPLQNPGPPEFEDRRGFRDRDFDRGAQGRQGFGPRGRDRRGPPDPMEVFNHFDTNGDDQLSRDEFMELAHKMREMRERMGRGGPQGFGQGPPGDGPRDRPPRPDRPRRPPPEFENAEPTESAPDENSA